MTERYHARPQTARAQILCSKGMLRRSLFLLSKIQANKLLLNVSSFEIYHIYPLGAEFSEKYHVSPLSILGYC